MKRSITLYNMQQAHTDLSAALEWVRPYVTAGHRMTVKFGPETRREAQNALLHAALTDIAKQCEWHGKRLSVDVWKRLCVAAWLREEGESPEMIPALDGKGFDVIFERTSTLSVSQCASLITWIHAFGAEQGVVFKELEYAE